MFRKILRFITPQPIARDYEQMLKNAFKQLQTYSKSISKGSLMPLELTCPGRHLPGFYSYKPLRYPVHVDALVLNDGLSSPRRFLIYLIEGELVVHELFHRRPNNSSNINSVTIHPVNFDEVSELLITMAMNMMVSNQLPNEAL